MQLMSWPLSRLGSRFGFLFEPYHRRVMHSALGRFLDEPLDLAVGLVEPDGTERVLPFTTRGVEMFNAEQFERINSITFRGYSEKYRLRFEFNIHAVFYPQSEELCILPAFYMEARVNPVVRVRWNEPVGPTPKKVKLFLRLERPDTHIAASLSGDGQMGRIDLAYSNRLDPEIEHPFVVDGSGGGVVGEAARMVQVRERIVSLNPGAKPDADGKGLSYEIPVTEADSGVKWRLVWGAHCGDKALDIGSGPGATTTGWLRYTQHWGDIDTVMAAAIAHRDDHLAHSRRFEKLFDQAPLTGTQRHLIHHSFQSLLSNTVWCNLDNAGEWFSVLDGRCLFHSAVDVEYNICLLYLTLWPRLMRLELNQWPGVSKGHEQSGGVMLGHDLGGGAKIGFQAYPNDVPVEENSNYLLMLQAYTHWTGDLSLVKVHGEFLERLAKFLLWVDRDGSGFPSDGSASAILDAGPAVQSARKQTYLAVKRLLALQAAADLLARAGLAETADRCTKVVERDAAKIEQQAWKADHYVVCTDRLAAGINDPWTGEPLPYEEIPGWDAYSLYTANGLLLPLLTGQPCPMDRQRLGIDLMNAARECLGRYGCGHTSSEVDNVWVSQNIWRDLLARFLVGRLPSQGQLYWDLQVMSNTHEQSLGYTDSYIGNHLSFHPRGIVSIGWLLSEPRLMIDRLAAGGTRITVEPDTQHPQRWPLLPLADWKAGKIPVCVVDVHGRVTIEGETDPIIVHGAQMSSGKTIG